MIMSLRRCKCRFKQFRPSRCLQIYVYCKRKACYKREEKKSNYLFLYSGYIKIVKTTFDFNFDLYPAIKQRGNTKTWKQREAVN